MKSWLIKVNKKGICQKMILSIIVFIMLVVVALLALLPSWLTHIEMTRDYTNVYGWSNYKVFKREFEKYNWKNGYDFYANSCWDRENDCEFHANIIKMNGVGMIMKNPIDLILARRHVKKSLHRRDVHIWS